MLRPWSFLLREIEVAVVEDDRAVLRGRLEPCPPGLGPHRDDQRVARQDGPAEARLHRAEAFRVRPAQGMQQRTAGEAVRAQAVQDRSLEAATGGERRIGVERIAVARQAIEEGLLRARRVLNAVVRFPFGLLPGDGRPAGAPEPSL